MAATIISSQALASAGTLLAHPGAGWVIGSFSLAAVILLSFGARGIARALRGKKAADVLTLVAAAMASSVAATGMWHFFSRTMHLPIWIQAVLFAFLEISVLASALRARTNVAREGQVGADGMAVWVLTCASGLMSASEAASPQEALVRLGAPLVAAWLWERSLVPERRAQKAAKGTAEAAIRWIFSVKRVAVRLGLATALGADLETEDASRRIDRFVRADNRAQRAGWFTRRSTTRRRGRAHARLMEQARMQADPRALYTHLGRQAILDVLARLGGDDAVIDRERAHQMQHILANASGRTAAPGTGTAESAQSVGPDDAETAGQEPAITARALPGIIAVAAALAARLTAPPGTADHVETAEADLHMPAAVVDGSAVSAGGLIEFPRTARHAARTESDRTGSCEPDRTRSADADRSESAASARTESNEQQTGRTESAHADRTGSEQTGSAEPERTRSGEQQAESRPAGTDEVDETEYDRTRSVTLSIIESFAPTRVEPGEQPSADEAVLSAAVSPDQTGSARTAPDEVESAEPDRTASTGEASAAVERPAPGQAKPARRSGPRGRTEEDLVELVRQAREVLGEPPMTTEAIRTALKIGKNVAVDVKKRLMSEVADGTGSDGQPRTESGDAGRTESDQAGAGDPNRTRSARTESGAPDRTGSGQPEPDQTESAQADRTGSDAAQMPAQPAPAEPDQTESGPAAIAAPRAANTRYTTGRTVGAAN